jgi:hypothetical protein
MQITASFAGVSFPKSQRLISRDVPGVTKASMIMTLSDVGAGMDAPVSYQLRYVNSKEEAGIVADRCVKGVLQNLWRAKGGGWQARLEGSQDTDRCQCWHGCAFRCLLRYLYNKEECGAAAGRQVCKQGRVAMCMCLS